jgi:chaperone BCS1
LFATFLHFFFKPRLLFISTLYTADLGWASLYTIPAMDWANNQTDSGQSSSCLPSKEANISGTESPFNATPDSFAFFNAVIPGFSIFSSALQTYLGIDLTLYIPFIAVICGAIFSWRYLSDFLWTGIEKYLMSSVKVRTDDEIYNILMAWVARQRFARSARRFIVNTDLNAGSMFWYRYYSDDDDEEDEEEDDEDQPTSSVIPGNPESKRKRLRYTPSFGSHIFWYKGHFLIFDRHENRDQTTLFRVSDKESLSISCFGRSPAILKELLHEARLEYLKKDERKTLIYRATGGQMNSEPSWQRCMARSNRPFSTVILNEKTKSDLVDDINDYLTPSTRRWYANRGIPYRRGYMLYGPPGTGKSSLSLALAGYFRMRIYIVSLNSIVATEENLANLFSELPRRCMVLLEDIDSAGLTHTREGVPESGAGGSSAAGPTPTGGDVPPMPGAPGPAPPSGRLSLSGLLNILDGVASQEGRILLMTTNHIEKLDKALIRPGRVDMMVKFSLADNELSASIFRAIYAPYEDEPPLNLGLSERKLLKAGADSDKDSSDDEKKHARATERVDALAKEFADRLPELEFSPAEIQGLLLKNKRSPRAALEQMDEWMEQTRKDRKEKEAKEAEKRRKEEAKWRKKQEKKKKRKEKRKAEKAKSKNKNDEKDGKKDDEKRDDDAAAGVSQSDDSSSGSESEAETSKRVTVSSKRRGIRASGRGGRPSRRAARPVSSDSSSSDTSSDESAADDKKRAVDRTAETTPEPEAVGSSSSSSSRQSDKTAKGLEEDGTEKDDDDAESKKADAPATPDN